MIKIGKYNELSILRKTSVGLYLGKAQGEEVLLPQEYMPKEYQLNDVLKVFVYRDNQGRKIATNLQPRILLHEFSYLKVTAVIESGAFLDWGLEKDLFVPIREQRQKMEIGRWYVVYMDLDQKTDRLFATNRINNYLQNDRLTVETGEQVDILILSKTDLGYSVIVNHQHKGLVYDNEIFESLKIGKQRKGYVKTIRKDNKLDISLQPIGYLQYSDANCKLIHEALLANKGSLPLSAKSSPEQIYKRLGISKKAFKKAIGALYKARKISIDPDGIRLLKP
jgi:predicted RNA-binding protein (virulence factor B family)